MRHNILAECVFVPRRDPVSVSLEAADRSSTKESARVVRNWRRLLLCARERAGEVGAPANGNVQRGGGCHVGAAADHRASVWGEGIRRAPRLLWAGRAARSVSAAALARKAFGGWCGGYGDPYFCRHDFCGGAEGEFCGAVWGGGGWGGGFGLGDWLSLVGRTEHWGHRYDA